MRKIITFLVRYPIWVTVLVLAVIIYGVVSLSQLRYSFFPENPPDTIVVEVAYPGASPDEVAEGAILKIEDNLDGLEGVEQVTSVSRENSGVVTVEISDGYDIDKVLSDIKNAVDRINSFPGGVEKPVIYARKFRTRSVTVGLHGETDLFNLKYLADELRDDLLATDEISQVKIAGVPAIEFSIEVSEANMRRYQLSFDEVRKAVAQANLNISGGKFDTKDEEILIRAWGRHYRADELLSIPVRGNANGAIVLLKDIATVKERWEDVPDKIFYNGQPAIMLNIDQTENEDIIAIADKAKEISRQFNQTHTNIEASVYRDSTIPLRQRVHLLINNGIYGLILVLICLGFFLNLRLSLWVSMGIPFSFAGMFIVANIAGITINIMSLAAMIIVVGILVDDAIVVGENIFAHYEKGKTALQAAIDGAMEVIAPVSASVLTTIIVFTAFFFLDSTMGKMMWQMGLVVIASLVFSLIEAFTVLPSHLTHSKGLSRHKHIPPIRQKIESGISYFTHRVYGRILNTTMNYKWTMVVLPIVFVMITIGLIGGGFIGMTVFPHVDSDDIPINISLVPGVQERETDSILTALENVCWQVNEELKAERPDSLDVIVGIERKIGSNDFGESGSHTGRLFVELLEGETRQMDSYIIANKIRQAAGPIPQAKNLTFGSGGHFGKAVSISLLGNDTEQLEKARDLLKVELQNMSSLKDVTDTDRKGRREIDITLKPQAYALGLTLDDVAGQVRQGFFGQEIQRIQRGRDEIKVWVRYRSKDRAALGGLDHMRIHAQDGTAYPFGELASYTIKRGIAQINHLNRKREIKVEADQADVKEDLPPILDEIRQDVLPRVLSHVQGITALFQGQSREQGKIMGSMKTAFSFVLLGVFVLVVLVFRSYMQAIIVFSLIPIGILGAFWGHGLHGLQINMLSIIGIIALAGIIVNDSIVFVDQINRFLRDGQKIRDAIYNAGIARLRPILLTTLTTAFGMGPLIFETSRQAQFLIPMAISIAYGLLFGTIILLLILPSTYLAFNSVRIFFARMLGAKIVSPEAVEPAVKELQYVQNEE